MEFIQTFYDEQSNALYIFVLATHHKFNYLSYQLLTLSDSKFAVKIIIQEGSVIYLQYGKIDNTKYYDDLIVQFFVNLYSCIDSCLERYYLSMDISIIVSCIHSGFEGNVKFPFSTSEYYIESNNFKTWEIIINAKVFLYKYT